MKRMVVPDAQTFVSAIQDEISRSPEARYFHRLHVLLYVLSGASAYQAAHLYRLSPRTVEYWVKRLISSGLAGLREGNRPGRPRRLSASDLEALRREIRRSPRELGYDQNFWDGVLLRRHLDQRYSVSLGVRQCQRLFHQLGFTLQRPRRKAREADPVRQEAFKKTSINGRKIPIFSSGARTKSISKGTAP